MISKRKKLENLYHLTQMDGMLHFIPNNSNKDNQNLLISLDKTLSSSELKMERLTHYMPIVPIWEHIWVWEEKSLITNVYNALSMDGFMTAKPVHV